MIWRIEPTIELLNSFAPGTLAGHLGIEFTEVGEDFMTARMPVDERTVQAFGVLHGGASASLAETLGSAAGAFCIDYTTKTVVGLELNCNHVRPMREGFVYGTARPIHLGNTTQIWDIRIVNAEDKLVCVARLTLAVVDSGGARPRSTLDP
ncbi:MAG: hotdog fold thioesterase [Chloroflexi bacterium]|nr:hotdog fold thioesterase [Chloroflexota bacterium]